ncbi:hypothetical protein D3C80_1961810 [compost metagenome]
MAFLMKSINRIAFFVTNPISIIMPIMENKFMVELNKKSAKNTPINDSGREAIIAAG